MAGEGFCLLTTSLRNCVLTMVKYIIMGTSPPYSVNTCILVFSNSLEILIPVNMKVTGVLVCIYAVCLMVSPI